MPKNLELIIIEDCSTDNTLKLLNKYGDSRIKLLVNKKNKGLSYSRNKGIKNATGKYLAFIDSDDYIPNDYFEKLHKSLIKNNADISICDFNIVYEDKNISSISPGCIGEVNSLNIINNGLAAACCNKLIKKESFKYPFEIGKINEDIASIIPIIANSKKVSYTNETYYNYIQRENSIQNSRFSDKRFDIFYGVELALSRIKNNKYYDNIEEALVYNQLIVLLLYVIPKDKSFFRRIKYIKRFVKSCKKYNILNNSLYLEFLNSLNSINKLYYRLLVNFSFLNLTFLSSLLISMYDLYKNIRKKCVIKSDISLEDLKKMAKKNSKMKKDISLTAIIPNYNYGRFLKQRLYSILYQTRKIDKIIILDDCSCDNSKIEMKKIQKEISKYINIELVYNKKNSGSPFKQWAKGISLSKTDYVWICEADDYCSKRFLKHVLKPIKNNKNIVISYANTAFIDTLGFLIMRNVIPQIDLMNTGHWKKNYVNDGLNEVENYAYLNCTIPNVSGAIIKVGNYDKEYKLVSHYHQAGDWLFYVLLMKYGDISFSKKTLNYYRVHGNNVSSVFKKQIHFKEIKDIHNYIQKNYNLEKNAQKEIEKRYVFLKKEWHLDEK